MASKKNRSGKANRKSPKSAASLRSRVGSQLQALAGWLSSRRWTAISIGVLVLFGASLIGGYWLARRLDTRATDAEVRLTLDDMKRRGEAAPPRPGQQQEPKYASIDEIPGMPRYTELDPGQKVPTHEEKPRNRQTEIAATSGPMPAWRRNAVPFANLNSRPLVAIVIDDVGLDRARSRRAWDLP